MSLGIPLSDQELEETKELIAQVHGKGFDDEPRLDRLCQLAIAWIKQNPEPLLLEKKVISGKKHWKTDKIKKSW